MFLGFINFAYNSSTEKCVTASCFTVISPLSHFASVA